jgi:hypothetical protein
MRDMIERAIADGSHGADGCEDRGVHPGRRPELARALVRRQGLLQPGEIAAFVGLLLCGAFQPDRSRRIAISASLRVLPMATRSASSATRCAWPADDARLSRF